MMKMKPSTLIALAVSAGLFSGAASAITGTSSVKATFTSTIEAGTCTAQIQDASSKAISTLPLVMSSNQTWLHKAAASPSRSRFPVAQA